MLPPSCLSDGGWALDALRRRPYDALQPAVAAMSNHSAQRYRRIGELCSDDESWRWVWRPREASRCSRFSVPSRAELCRRFSGRRVLLYGDSLTQQHTASLVSLLGGPVEARPPEPCRLSRTLRKLQCVRACPGGAALVCHRFGYGLMTHGATDGASPPRAPHGCRVNATALTTEAAFPPACLQTFDAVLIGAWAHWAGVDGAWGLEACLRRARGKEGQQQHAHSASNAPRIAQAWVRHLFNRTAFDAAAFLQSGVVAPSAHATGTAARRPRVFFVTAAPGVPPPDVLAPDPPSGATRIPTAAPPTQRRPSPSREDFGVGAFRAPRNGPHAWAEAWRGAATSPFNHHMVFALNDATRAAATAHGLELLDLEGAMLARVDGHRVDRLHYCLPGPPDFLAYALAATVDW